MNADPLVAGRSLTPLLLDPLADERWLDFVARAPSASVFHHTAWLRLLQRQYGY